MRLGRRLQWLALCAAALHTAQAADAPQRRVTGTLQTRDGVALRYSALLPPGRGPFPVIVNYSGYDAGAVGGLRWREGDTAMSADLDRTLLAYGPASADLWVSATSADADLQVTLTELRPDGQEMFVQRGWLRLSNRALDPARTTPLRPVPVDRPEAIVPLDPGVPVLARVELGKFAHAFRRGSRLRLWVDAPSAWGGYTFDYYATPARVTLWRDPAHRPLLRIGVLDDVLVPEAPPSCGEVLGQPCRADPLAGAH